MKFLLNKIDLKALVKSYFFTTWAEQVGIWGLALINIKINKKIIVPNIASTKNNIKIYFLKKFFKNLYL